MQSKYIFRLLDLSGIFYPNIFDLWLDESVDVNPQMWNPGELAVCPFLVRGSHEPFSLHGPSYVKDPVLEFFGVNKRLVLFIKVRFKFPV